MLYRSSKLLPLLFVWAALLTSVQAQVLDYQARLDMEREITRLLLEKDVGEVANQLALETAPSRVAPLLRRLNVFARAGHRARFLQTLDQLAEASDMPPVSERWVVAEALKEIIGQDDLAALRTYYERLMPADAAGAENLLRLWERDGDAKELDAWLAARSGNDEWFQLRIHWRTKLGTVNELLDALAADVRAHPKELERVFRYLSANAWAGRPQNVEWLNGIFETWLADIPAPERGAYELYELGARLRVELPQIASKLLERSLRLPFTLQDMQFIRERVILRFSIQPRVKNWEKQLRFWTKRQLAEAYRSTNQPQAAQPLVEELIRLKEDDDILAEDVHQLAGAVQRQSGMRVVEAKILNDEASGRESVAYWTERARYYKGRKEYETVMETYRQALASVLLKPNDEESVQKRLSLLKEFAIFAASIYGGDEGNRDAHRAQIKQVLRREFAATPPETSYAFGVARIITDSEFDLDDLRDSLLVKERDLLPRMLAARVEWAGEESGLIETVICREALTPEQKAFYWTQLEGLTKSGAASRSFYLADALLSCNEPRRAIPLFLRFLKHVRERRGKRDAFWEEQATSNLFKAYLDAGNWQEAEKLLFERKDLTGRQLIYELSRVAQTAARVGAFDEAVRLWSIKANLDRRHLDGLAGLAATKAREPLRELYERMKKKDTHSFVPDVALKVLQ
ncbi:MAG TPA: hypothetical protein VF766_10525 [Pyrinomonadaceae bacterium]